jgi:hypothetical protein
MEAFSSVGEDTTLQGTTTIAADAAPLNSIPCVFVLF